ncbi:hypothetical protein STVIR_4504 [Streptomyces viridochromogenes Tue57]|uniref:Uncharacterized protein n=1 Tax=Streptomyces viridochromogenes Tue57 TaxID=1160705 RepID=L8PDE3_STRVR|nr:hypothetical protein STVIR_4504 [Streptomyces viridochromogenes Tue57]
MRLQHTAVGPHDPAHDRLVHRVSPGVRPAHLDPYDLTALGRRDDDGVVQVTARRHGRVAGRVDAGDIRDEMRERGGEALRVDLRLDGRGVHGELHPSRPDELDGPVDTGGDDGVEHHLRTGDPAATRVEALVLEDVVDQSRDARVTGRQVMQHLIGLGPQLPRVVRGERGQLTAKFVERTAQRTSEQGQQLFVPPGEGLVPVLLPLPEGGIPLLARGELLLVPFLELLKFRHMLLPQGGQLGGVLLGEPLQLLLVPLLRGGLLLGEGVVGPTVGEGHHGADELLTVTHGRGRQVDGHLVARLGPQHLPTHPVLAPRTQGVGERRLLVREGRPVGTGVQHEGVQLPPAQVTGPVTQYLSGGRIDEYDPPVGVGPDDAFRRGPQDHLGLPLRTRQLGLGVDGPGQIPYDEHEQLVTAVAVAVVGLLPVLKIRGRDLDRELAAVRPPGHHPGRLGPPLRVHVVGPPHGSGDQLGVEVRQQIEQPAPDQRGPGRLEGLQRDGVGVDDGPIGVDQHQRIGKRVEYGCEASSASGWPAAHETLPPCYRTLPTARAILPTGPRRVTRGSLRAGVALATPDERDVARRSDPERMTACAYVLPAPCQLPSGFLPASRDLRGTFTEPVLPPWKACTNTYRTPCFPDERGHGSRLPLLTQVGKERYEPVPPGDLTPVRAVVPRVHGTPGPGPRDMRGGRPAVLHGAEAAPGDRSEGVLAPPGASLQRGTGPAHVRVIAAARMAVQLVRPVGHAVTAVAHGHGEVISGPARALEGRRRQGRRCEGRRRQGGQRRGRCGHGGEGRADDDGTGGGEENPPQSPPPTGTSGTSGTVDLQHDLTNAAHPRTLRPCPRRRRALPCGLPA